MANFSRDLIGSRYGCDMTPVEWLALGLAGSMLGILARILWRASPEPAALPELEAPDFSGAFTLDEDLQQWVGMWKGAMLSVRALADPAGRRLECRAPIRGRTSVGFLVSRRDPRRQRGAPLGVEGLDDWLQVYTSSMTIPEDFSWLAGQADLLGTELHPPGGVRFLAEEDVAEALQALLPSSREGSHVNSAGVLLVERGVLDVAGVRALLDGAAAVACAIERAIDPWALAATRLGLSVSPHDVHGDRVVEGVLRGSGVRARMVIDDDGDALGVEVQVDAAHAGLSIRAGAGGLPLQNILLDGRICVEGVPSPGLQDRLNAPDAAGDMLSVFGPWPASQLTDGVLRIFIPTLVDGEGLVDAIEAGCRCVERLHGKVVADEPPSS